MPFDAMLLSLGVAAVFVVFAGVLWGDAQTRTERPKADAGSQKRRSFSKQFAGVASWQ